MCQAGCGDTAGWRLFCLFELCGMVTRDVAVSPWFFNASHTQAHVVLALVIIWAVKVVPAVVKCLLITWWLCFWCWNDKDRWYRLPMGSIVSRALLWFVRTFLPAKGPWKHCALQQSSRMHFVVMDGRFIQRSQIGKAAEGIYYFHLLP